MQSIFNYIVGSSKTDAYVGRIQSGWANIHEGGVCPNIEAIPLFDQEVFKNWSLHLLGSVELDTASLQSIACVLLLHYRSTLQYIPTHRLHSRMKECIRMCNFDDDKLLQWSDSVKVRFSIENGIFLPLDKHPKPRNVLDQATSEAFNTDIAEIRVAPTRRNQNKRTRRTNNTEEYVYDDVDD